jgi:diamine N-acetyltransferase
MRSDQETTRIFTGTVTLRSGEPALVRPLQAGDATIFGVYLGALSPDTRDRYGPHPFDQETANRLCAAINLGENIRVIATIPAHGGERMIAYVILVMGVSDVDVRRYQALGIPINQETDCTLAPSVADDYQDQGVGRLVVQRVIDGARELGRKRMVLMGGVQATNDRGVHFYTRFGFRKVGEFYTDRNNFDMILDL